MAFGLGPRADSLADNLIFAIFCLNRLKPAIYFSAFNFLGFGKFIIYIYYLKLSFKARFITYEFDKFATI